MYARTYLPKHIKAQQTHIRRKQGKSIPQYLRGLSRLLRSELVTQLGLSPRHLAKVAASESRPIIKDIQSS